MGKLTSLLILALTLILATLSTKGAFASTSVEPRPTVRYVPTGTVEYRSIDGVAAADGDVSRSELAPFQLCVECRCCAVNDLSYCLSMPCCFAIDCNLPDKPFGVCAFVPRTCSCTSCS